MTDEIHCVATEEICIEGEMKTYSQCVNHLCREKEKSRRSSFLGDQVQTSYQEQSSYQGQIPQSIHQEEKYYLVHQVQRLSPGDKDQVQDMEIKVAGNYENKKRKQLVRQLATIDYAAVDDKREEESTMITSPDGRLTSKISKVEEEVSSSVMDHSSKYQHYKTENIIYNETIDISPCSTSSSEVVTSSTNKNKEQTSILKLKKQKTIESASSRGGSPRYLPRQYSGASSSSVLLSIHPSPSSSTYGPITPKLTLVRGQSCSLVDIPTYLGSSIELGNVTKVNPVIDNSSERLQNIKHVSMENMMRLKQEILKSRNKKKPARKTECILICIALSFLLVCIAMVGTMLSYTTNYQDRAIAETMFYNHNTSYSFNNINKPH